MGHRVVREVEWARECAWPSFIPQPKRLRGTKALGLGYERKLARELARSLPKTRHGQWYEYCADSEKGWCQPDFVVPLWEATLVLECKLANIEQAQAQLSELYVPILRQVYEKPVRAIIVSKSVRAIPRGVLVCGSLLDAIRLTGQGECPVLHWLGRGPL